MKCNTIQVLQLIHRIWLCLIVQLCCHPSEFLPKLRSDNTMMALSNYEWRWHWQRSCASSLHSLRGGGMIISSTMFHTQIHTHTDTMIHTYTVIYSHTYYFSSVKRLLLSYYFYYHYYYYKHYSCYAIAIQLGKVEESQTAFTHWMAVFGRSNLSQVCWGLYRSTNVLVLKQNPTLPSSKHCWTPLLWPQKHVFGWLWHILFFWRLPG